MKVLLSRFVADPIFVQFLDDTAAATAIAQQALSVPSQMDALLAATHAAQVDAGMIAEAAVKTRKDAAAWYASAGDAIADARAHALTGALGACLKRRQAAEAEHAKLRGLLDTAEQYRNAAALEADKAATSSSLLNDLLAKIAAQASGASCAAGAGGGCGAFLGS